MHASNRSGENDSNKIHSSDREDQVDAFLVFFFFIGSHEIGFRPSDQGAEKEFEMNPFDWSTEDDENSDSRRLGEGMGE
jgi:hypothetical protein